MSWNIRRPVSIRRPLILRLTKPAAQKTRFAKIVLHAPSLFAIVRSERPRKREIVIRYFFAFAENSDKLSFSDVRTRAALSARPSHLPT